VNAGATWLDQELVQDQNLTTSRGPQDLAAFVPAMLEAFAKTRTPANAAETRPQSDPQREAPPGVVVLTLRRFPRPSTIAMAGIGMSLVASRAFRGAAART
jgi:protease I